MNLCGDDLLTLSGNADEGLVLMSAMEKASEAVAKVLTVMNKTHSDVKAEFPVQTFGWHKGLEIAMVDIDKVTPYIRQWVLRATGTKERYTDYLAFYKACLQTPGATVKRAAIVNEAMKRAWQQGLLDSDTQNLVSNPSGYIGGNIDQTKAWLEELLKKAQQAGTNAFDVAKVLPYLVPVAAIGIAIWVLMPYREAGKRL